MARKNLLLLQAKLLAVFLLAILATAQVSAQLTINRGTQFFAGNERLTLHNEDFINHGNFKAGTGVLNFTGNLSTNIFTDQLTSFFDLQVDKKNSASVVLQNSIGVTNHINFPEGFLNLNGFNIDLNTTGKLINEHETSRIVGINGGFVGVIASLAAPTNANPGNLGAIITSAQNMGTVVIHRGHKTSVVGQNNNSILRYYDISPAINTNLNATLRFNYFDGELISFNGNLLTIFSSEDSVNWSNRGFSSRSLTDNFVTQTGINSFSRWTLSTDDNRPLDVFLIFFEARCEQGKVVLAWKTAQEQNSSRFDIERNVDGTNWSTIGSLPAAGNSSSERNYSFADLNPVVNAQYRLAEYDITGAPHYTNILRSPCDVPDLFSIWPNPVHDKLFINITSSAESPATIRLFDSKGALIKIQKTNVLRGYNQFTVDIQSLPAGTYFLSAEWNNGKMKKGLQIVKQ